jgi:hypothetical protein
MLKNGSARSLSELKNFLNEVGEPSGGKVRVYRGQTREYPDESGRARLLPALLRHRTQLMYDPAWLGTMASFVARQALPAIGLDYPVAQIWAPALIQHYGPGSHYLDVTHDLEIAVWFSLLQYHELWIALKEGDDPKDLRDFFHKVAWFTDADEPDDKRKPIIYAFDVEPWNGDAVANHGQLVDLLVLDAGRQLATKAPRIRAQSAALIYSDPGNPLGPNLHSYLVARVTLTEPFDFECAPVTQKHIHEIFPAPTGDPLYKALLEIPAFTKFHPSRLEQPLPIPLVLGWPLRVRDSPMIAVLGGSGTYEAPLQIKFRLGPPGPDLLPVAELRKYLLLGSHMTPPLLHHSLVGAGLEPVEIGGRSFGFEHALALMLEAPLWTFTPNVNSTPGLGMWIQSALPLGIADKIAGHSTDSVYLELCPVDVILPGENIGEDLLRAVWVVKAGSDYAVTVSRASRGKTDERTVLAPRCMKPFAVVA